MPCYVMNAVLAEFGSSTRTSIAVAMKPTKSVHWLFRENGIIFTQNIR